MSKKRKKRSRTVQTVGVKGDARVQLTRNVSETEVELLAHRGFINDYQLIAGRLCLRDFSAAQGSQSMQMRDYIDDSPNQGPNDGVLAALDRIVRIGKQLKPECHRVWYAVVCLDLPCENRFLPDLRTALDVASDLYQKDRLDIDVV